MYRLEYPWAYATGLAAAWRAADPVLPDGMPGHEKDSGRRKVGDGARRWTQLPYVTVPQADRGRAGGVVPLDATGQVPAVNMPYQVLRGTRSVTSTTPEGVEVRVDFARPFGAAPSVQVNPRSTVPVVAGAMDVTATGFTLHFTRSTTTATNVTWLAVGQPGVPTATPQ